MTENFENDFQSDFLQIQIFPQFHHQSEAFLEAFLLLALVVVEESVVSLLFAVAASMAPPKAHSNVVLDSPQLIDCPWSESSNVAEPIFCWRCWDCCFWTQ